MNIVELDGVLSELKEIVNSNEKTASQNTSANPLEKKAEAMIRELEETPETPFGLDFHEQLNVLHKKANETAREVLNLDTKKIGNPRPLEALKLAFGVDV